MAVCGTCFRHCDIGEGQTGFCGARVCEGGSVRPRYYGAVSALCLDPIEKKPLRRFYPGAVILSVGSLGCNLRCPFCQNHEISSPDAHARLSARYLSPDELARTAEAYAEKGSIGLAFTYNEPLVGWEFVRDTAKLIHERGLLNVLVTNGTAELPVLEELLPYIDAMNIDLKGFTEKYYRDVLCGDLSAVRAFIARAVKGCHVELTTLIVPGENDSEEEMRALSAWIADLKNADGEAVGPHIPLHVSRFFPRWRMTDRDATDVKKVYRLAETAREKLLHVYTGNC
ncbi:MAG: AmmeMemoRadiSam system radical SAM enzyme [Oscillospiraceae bacterium]|nr:AmmeMemoRadiSam system radical SAM enzyme [Oscillospiraceae bacterium]